MLEGMTPPTPGSLTCKVKTTADGLDEKDRAVFVDAIIDTKLWPANTLSNSLRQRGVSIADVTITKHRRQVCSCFRA